MPLNRKGRLRDAAILVPLGGLCLFMPPYIRIFDQPATLFGIPVLHVYIFSAWTLGIVLTAIVARRIARADRWPETPTDPPPGPPHDQPEA